nr:uncharacterized protein LOC111503088 isoform X2 [Leptinotarsa decemlineata]
MRLFKRRNSDPNPQLESLSTLSEIEGNITQSARVPSTETFDEASKSNLSGWGRTWEKLKRGDSSEQLRSKNKKRSWSALRKRNEENRSTSPGVSNDEEENSDLQLSQMDLKKIYDMYRNMCDKPEKILSSKRKAICMSDSLELSQQQFLEYLILMKPNVEELDKIFSNLNIDSAHSQSKLDIVSEEKRQKPSRFKSFFSRSTSKSDDEGDFKRHPKNSSTDSLTSLINFIMPSRKSVSNFSPRLPSKFKSDESGYGSDSTKAASIDSPVGSIKSQISNISNEQVTPQNISAPTKDYSDEDTDTAEEDNEQDTTFTPFVQFPSKKRSRSRSADYESLSRRKAFKFKKSPIKKDMLKMSIEDLTQTCDKLQLDQGKDEAEIKSKQASSSIEEKEFKCVRLKVGRNETVGIEIGPSTGQDSSISYSIINLLPYSVAKRNGILRIGDEVVRLNGVRIKGCPVSLVESYLEPKNGELEIIISRLPEKTIARDGKRKKNSFLGSSLFTNKQVPSNRFTNLNVDRSRFVGLSDILKDRNGELESKVTFSEKPRPPPEENAYLFKKPLPDRRSIETTSGAVTGMRKFSMSSEVGPKRRSDVGQDRNLLGFQLWEAKIHQGGLWASMSRPFFNKVKQLSRV